MSIQEQYDESLKSKKKAVDKFEDLLPKYKKIAEALRHARRFMNISTMFMGDQLLVRVRVDKMADVSPLIECLEEDLAIEFDKTRDQAEYSWREFTCATAPWIRVDAELVADGPECKRVIVGYKQEPVYELKCGEEANTPDVQPPSQTEWTMP